MCTRIGLAALLLALIALFTGCDAEQLDRGTVPTPWDTDCKNPPDWVNDAVAGQESAQKLKEKYKGSNSPVAPQKLRTDVDYQVLNQPLSGRVQDTRLVPLREPVEQPWRGDVPSAKKTVVAVVPADAVASVIDLNAVAAAAAAAQRDPTSSAGQADVVNLDIISARPVATVAVTSAAKADVTTATGLADAIRSASASREAVPAASRVPGTAVADTFDLPALVPLSRIEQLYNNSLGLSRGRRLEQFGYKVFANTARIDANLPPDPEFVIGPGDEIHIRSVNNFEYDKTLTVERDGTIFIDKDNVGSVKVAQLRFRDLTALIRAAIAKVKGENKFDLDVSLGKLHSIRVQVYGYVRSPSLQGLGANATLMDALLAAGGPTKDGTLRDIIIQRAGQPDTHVDLYGLIAARNGTADVVLLAGDRVFVGPIGATAAVIGPAGSGIYELLNKTTLANLMGFAGRINTFTQLNNVQIERSFNNLRREVQAIDYARIANTFVLQDGDVVAFSQINTVLNDTVAIAGAVVRPGTFPFKDGMTVSDLIRRASGFVLDASLDRALIQRPLGNSAVFDIMSGDRAGTTREEAIWVDLAGILAGNKQSDILLHRLDTLKIFTYLEARDDATVKITGGIRKPGIYKLTAGLTLGDLIRLAGGPTTDAFPGESKIIRLKRTNGDMQMNVENYKFRLDEVQRRLADYDLLLENQDQIVIKRVQSLQVSVRIGGRVQFPGTYVLPDGSKISNLLAEAGGLLPDADLRAAVFTRKKIQQLQQARLDDLFTRMEQWFGDGRNRVIRDGRNNEGISAHLAYLGLGQLTNNIERFQARGRLVVNMLCDNFLSAHENVVLEDGDELYIPRRENIVMVLGEANYPNAFVWNNALTVGDYISRAGGALPEADKKQIYVIMSNGEVFSDANKNMFGGSVAGFRPGPGDTILIPKKPPSRGKLTTASDITLLVRQMAETGLIGASIPQTFAPNHPANVSIGLNPSNQTPPDIITNQAPEQFYNDTRAKQQQVLDQQNK